MDGDPATGTADQDVTVELAYSADRQIATRKAKGGGKGDTLLFLAESRRGLIKTVANTSIDVVTGTADQDVTVELTYHADGQIATRKAKNSTTGDQTTTTFRRPWVHVEPVNSTSRTEPKPFSAAPLTARRITLGQAAAAGRSGACFSHRRGEYRVLTKWIENSTNNGALP